MYGYIIINNYDFSYRQFVCPLWSRMSSRVQLNYFLLQLLKHE